MRLVIFDLDVTLVDRRATIIAWTQEAHQRAGLAPPTAEATWRLTGLSLPQAMCRLLD